MKSIPAEKDDADNLARYAESKVGAGGAFVFTNRAPGRYWLLAQPRTGTDLRPLFWDATARAGLRREAEAARHEITLTPCQRVTDYGLRY